MGRFVPIAVVAALACSSSPGPEPKSAGGRAIEVPKGAAPALEILGVEPETGAFEGGNEVRVLGRGSLDGATIYFAGREARIVKRRIDGDRFTLYAKVPPGPSGMSVDIVIVAEEQATLENAYTYAARPVKIPEKVIAKAQSDGLEDCEEYFDLIERCMARNSGSSSAKQAIDRARKSMREMVETASEEQLAAMNSSCRKAMESALQSSNFQNCP